jgi:hypothetical protein
MVSACLVVPFGLWPALQIFADIPWWEAEEVGSCSRCSEDSCLSCSELSDGCENR